MASYRESREGVPRRRPEVAGTDQRSGPGTGEGAAEGDDRWQLQPPTLAMPATGGAIRGLGESFTATVSGSASLTVPLALPAGRGDLTPAVALSYTSQGGNGPCGLGWDIGAGSVSLRTEAGVPRYQDRDQILLDGAEIVPLLDGGGAPVEADRTVHGRSYRIRRYRSRVGPGHSRIERWTDLGDGREVAWRSIGPTNVTTWYGRDEESRIADPTDRRRIAVWLRCLTYDDHGNAIVYRYAAENSTGVAVSVEEAGRTPLSRTAGRYLRQVHYGNRTPYRPVPAPDGDETPLPEDWLFHLVLDYGDHSDTGPGVTPALPWPVRPDPFSTYRYGFEVRTYRRCERALVFHQMPELGADPVLVAQTRLTYRAEDRQVASMLAAVGRTGHGLDAAGTPSTRSLPELRLGYVPWRRSDEAVAVPRAELTGDPVGLDGHAYEWADLDGDGVAGILARRQDAWYYKRNLSPLTHLEPGGPSVRFAPPVAVPERPSGLGRRSRPGLRGPILADVDGDGQLDLLSFDRTGGGVALRNGRDWDPYRTFPAPAADSGLVRSLLADLTGDGTPDLLLLGENAGRWYEGRGAGGFGPPQAVRIEAAGTGARAEGTSGGTADGEVSRALRLAQGGEASLLLADLSGDGLTDLVLVTRSQVTYWPNLGHGRFGGPVVMRDAPVLDAPEAFEPARVILADIDGSGPADLVYLAADGVRLYRNLSGNAWSDPIVVRGVPSPDRLTYAAVIDLFGRGTGCLVWSTSSPSADGRAVHYVDLAAGGKPHLLASYDGGLGSVVSLEYLPSTAYAQADARAGRPWATRLPFPVHCVSRVTTADAVRGTAFTTTTTYHHGQYDGEERVFRGFGRIDRRDTEDYATGPHDVPPVLRREWFHVGVAHREGELVQHAYRDEYAGIAGITLPEPGLPAGVDPRTAKQAARALAGAGLRQELYAEDGTDRAAVPFTVFESTYDVRLVQPAGDGAPPAFRVDPVGQVGYGSERDPADPRVTQTLVLDVDDMGLVTRSAIVVHPRRAAGPALPAEVRAAQQASVVTYTDHALTTDVTGDDVHRLRVVHDTRAYELRGVTVPAGTALTAKDIGDAIAGATDVEADLGIDPPAPVGVERRLLAHRQVDYLDADLAGPLAHGLQAWHGLVHQSFRLSMTASMATARYGDVAGDAALLDAALLAAGYVHRGDDAWWAPSGRWGYPADARAHFLLPDRLHDALGATTTVERLHDLLVTAVEDAHGHRGEAGYDLRALAPALVTDGNGNRSAARYDPLGCVVATALMGKAGANEGDTLDDPTTRLEYDLDRWRTSGRPAVVRSFARERHGDPGTRWFETRRYLDGGGAVAATKTQAAPGLAGHWDEATGTLTEVDTTPEPRWIGTGRTVLNNKGLPVLAYEPYFTDTPEYDSAAALVEAGVSDVVRYDALGRSVRVDHPDGTFGRVEFGPWGGTGHDAADTVLDSRWYAERGSPDPAGPEPADPEERAAWLTARHAGTPTTTHLDVLGRPVLVEADNGADGVRRTRAARDLTGMHTRVHDSRDRPVASTLTDLLGRPVVTESAERGRTVVLPDVLGQAALTVDGAGRRFRVERDDLHRPTGLWCRPAPGDPERLLAWGRYVDDAARNTVGRVVQIYDHAGRIDVDGYDFTGAATGASRRYALDATVLPDWSGVAAAADPDAAAAVLLDAETFHGTAEHDAVGRLTRASLPDDSVITPAYDEGSRLSALDVLLGGAAEPVRVLAGRDHDASGRPLRSELGNGLTTTHDYDPLSRRLTGALTRGAAGPPLQDFAYTYDAVGNVTTVDDGAQQTVFFDNAVVTPRRDFAYDALSQLVRATGRELAALTRPDAADAPVRPLPHPNDTLAVRRYAEEYTYDDLGNLRGVAHTTATGGWTRRHRYTYETDPADRTNRLAATSLPGDPDGVFSETYHHDGLGNIDTAPNVNALIWDVLDRLGGADLFGGGSAFYHYDVAGTRVRKVVQRSGLVIETLYLGAVEIVRRRRNGQLVSERRVLHVSGDDGRIARFDRVTVAESGPLPAPTLRYVHGDRQGSATLHTDELGRPVCHEEFHPFGTTAYRSAAPSEDVSLSRYRFCERERDDETGLVLMGLRYYAPWLGRWVSPDPVGYLDGFNLYRYSHNNPATLCDPSGMGPPKTQKKHVERVVPGTVQTPAEFRTWAENEGIWYVGTPYKDAGGWHVDQWGRYPTGEGGGRPHGGPVARPPGDEPPGEGGGGGAGAGENAGAGAAAGTGQTGTGTGAGQAGGGQGAGAAPSAPAAPGEGAGTGEGAKTGEGTGAGTGAGAGAATGEGAGAAGQGGGTAAQTGPSAERFIWEYDFPGTGVAGSQRGRILEWFAGVPWRDNTEGIDKITGTAVQQIKSTSVYDTVGNLTRSATRDAQAYIAANPTTTTGLRPQAVIITPTDAPAQAATDIADALNPGRGRKIPSGALPPEHVRGLPGAVGAISRGLTVGGTVLAAGALAYDIYKGDVPMAIGDALSTAGGGLEVYALATPGATVAGVSAVSAGLVLGGAGIAIASGVSAYRAYQRGDTAGVVAGLVGVAAGLAIMAGVIFGAPLLLAAGIIGAIGVGLFHLARWLF